VTDDAHDAHDEDHDEDHDGHGAPAGDGWVLVPLAVAFVIGLVILVVLGLDSGAAPFA
jgi:hypothetical protein